MKGDDNPYITPADSCSICGKSILAPRQRVSGDAKILFAFFVGVNLGHLSNIVANILRDWLW